MKALPVWLSYTVLRLLLFAIPLAILLILRIQWWIAVPAAALIALPLSYILLSRPRHEVALQLDEVRRRDKLAPMHDDTIEDAQIDEAELTGEQEHGRDGATGIQPESDAPQADAPESGQAASARETGTVSTSGTTASSEGTGQKA